MATHFDTPGPVAKTAIVMIHSTAGSSQRGIRVVHILVARTVTAHSRTQFQE